MAALNISSLFAIILTLLLAEYSSTLGAAPLITRLVISPVLPFLF